VAGWELSIALEDGNGPEAAERFVAAPVTLSLLGSKCREGYLLFALARCWAQAGSTRDGEALRALDAADRLAPVVVRNDPLARELVLTLDHRARHRYGSWTACATASASAATVHEMKAGAGKGLISAGRKETSRSVSWRCDAMRANDVCSALARRGARSCVTVGSARHRSFGRFWSASNDPHTRSSGWLMAKSRLRQTVHCGRLDQNHHVRLVHAQYLHWPNLLTRC
jgi:hypothetical protein